MQALLFYIDPGSGSFLLQFLIGAFLAVSVFFRSLRQKILGVFGRRKATDDTSAQDPHES